MTLSPLGARIMPLSIPDAPTQGISPLMPQGSARPFATDTLIAPAAPEQPSDHRKWGQLHGCSDALAICESARAHKGLTLVVTRSTADAIRLEQAIRFFLNLPPEEDGATVSDDGLELLSLPDWETLPYDLFSPHQDITSRRIRTLHRLPSTRHGILVVPARTLMHRLAPPSYLQGNTLLLKTGQTLDIESWRLQLEAAGYHHAENVYEHGEYAVRGAILDLYPMGSELPYRIDLFDNEIDTLRTFDPETQRSIEQVDSIRLLPAREFPFDKQARNDFRGRFRERFDVDFRRCPLFQDVSNGILAGGIEAYFPLFFEQSAQLFDYLPADCPIFTLPGIEQAATQFWQDIKSRYEERRGDLERPLLAPGELYLAIDELFAHIKQHRQITLLHEPLPDRAGNSQLAVQPFPDLSLQARSSEPLSALKNYIQEHTGRILFSAETAGRREILLELLQRIELQPRVVESWADFLDSTDSYSICVAPIEQGMQLEQLALIPESALLGQRVSQRQRRDKAGEHASELVIRNLTELREGAPVVHIDHGVGRYRGLTTLTVDGQATEFLQLEYAEQAKLYVPVAHLHLIARYSGSDDDGAPLHRLGSDQWSKAKRKAAEQVRDVAAELLDIYARRAARKGHAFGDPGADYATFSAAFPYEERSEERRVGKECRSRC